ncbi:hypothetical protein RRG08_001505 [Elysia crispata]|uniref:Bifunctional lysine-specific demethylase and histidyl-hydroxylase n=1 Tax=Elysia crispata TaxID=231223 RepID=A0AAE1ACL2_9GAST|nr:hypothetical protein RRG08_001505 [Elysia crispata]
MKRVSAFAVFHSKKKSTDDHVIQRPPPGADAGGKNLVPLRRAHSSQSVEKGGKQREPGSASKGKRFLNALKHGTIRESIRMSGKKQQAPSLTSLNVESPFPGFSQISLVGPKGSEGELAKARKKLLETNPSPKLTPVTRKSLRERKSTKAVRETPTLSRKAVQNSIISLTTKSPKKAALKTSQSLTNANEEVPDRTSSTIRASKNEKRRKESESSSATGRPKKRKTDIGDLVNKIEKVQTDVGNELPYMYDSTEEARKLFECMIHPVTPDRFFTELWEKKPLLVKRHTSDYNRGWFSTAEFDKILRQENIQWGVNLDATSFLNDKRETHNQTGRAHAPVVWDMYQAGCSMRLLNPQTYSRNVWKVLSVLQEYFGCCVGANIYLTPPGTQGFAPHFDDIEAFILQLEGKKHWRLYSPRNDDEVLPRFSSGNFSQSEFGEPILDTVLEAGDLLYFPRGTIHQGDATDEHSLHITVSCYQLNTWGDLLMKLLPSAIEMAIEENPAFRVGLPRNFLNYMGIVHSEKDLPERTEFVGKLQTLIGTLMESLPVDAACDQMGKQLMVDSMPPVLSEVEKSCSVHAAGERWDPDLKRVLGVSELEPDTAIKLIRRGCLR